VWKKIKNYYKTKVRQNLFFESVAGSLIGIVTISFSFELLAKIYPDTYRRLTKWANTPLKPIPMDCKFEEKLPNVAQARELKIYRVTISFDTDKIANKDVIVYSLDQQFAILDPDLNHNPQDCDYRKYMAIIPVNKGELNFEVIGKPNNIPTGKIEYPRCNLKVQFIND